MSLRLLNGIYYLVKNGRTRRLRGVYSGVQSVYPVGMTWATSVMNWTVLDKTWGDY